MVSLFKRRWSLQITSPTPTITRTRSRSRSIDAPRPLRRYFSTEADSIANSLLKEKSLVQRIKAKDLVHIEEKELDEVIRIWTARGGTNELQQLKFVDIGFGVEHAKIIGKLLRTNQVANIKVLKVPKNRFHGDAAKTLFKALAQNSTVLHLDLSNNTIGDKECKALAKYLKVNRCLRYLDISSNRIGPAGAKRIAKALATHPCLERLYLQGNNFKAKGSIPLAQMLLDNHTLRHVDLGFNRLHYEGVTNLSHALLGSTQLKSLRLDLNEVGYLGICQLSHALTINTALTHLNLTCNNLGDEGVAQFCQRLTTRCSLESLDISGNNCGQNGSSLGAKAIAELLKQSTTLRILNLDSNPLGDANVEIISKALAQNTTLEKLYLSNCRLGVQGIQALAEALKTNTTLQVINLADNVRLGPEGHWLIANALEINTNIKIINLDYNIADWQKLYNSIQSSLTRNYMLQRTKHYNACEILRAARVLFHGRPKTERDMIDFRLPHSPEQLTRSIPLVQGFNLSRLPTEVIEGVLGMLDMQQVLNPYQRQRIFDYAADRQTLKSIRTKRAFLEGTLGRVFDADEGLWEVEPEIAFPTPTFHR
ncbi:hypothetical protein BZG36_04393 [Bifiguratus adelaidae]|uniref:F-box domain-containing protein n=1 Tax=Bifiguratus adelaidae TaxID=1938954 RepID=A0A261XVR7_9FUNG|nr:hypothetical protein BZG36_04393 [Bifiguratus adelaidae]